jgi:hypothetical protein
MYEMIEVISMLNTINNNIGSLTESNLFSSESDITSLYRICKTLKTNLSQMYLYKIYNEARILNNFKDEYNMIRLLYIKGKYNMILDSLDTMNWLYHNGLLDTDKGFLYWLKKSLKFKNILMNDLNKNKLNIQKICSEYSLNYNSIYTYYENLINNIISILSANIFSDMDYNIINPLIKASELNIDLMKIISKNTIEEKLNICFFMAQPRNFSVIYDDNYINMYRTKCNISYNKSLKKLNTLCNNISSMIGYYQIKSLI